MKARLTLFGMPLIGVETGQDAGGVSPEGKATVSGLKARIQKTAQKVVEKTSTPNEEPQVRIIEQ
jgi:hypothetical protein